MAELKATILIEGLSGILNDRNLSGAIGSGSSQIRTYRIKTMDLSGEEASLSVYDTATNEERTVRHTEMLTPGGYDFGDFSIDYGQTVGSVYSIHAKRDCVLSYRNRDSVPFSRKDLAKDGVQPLFAYNDALGEAFVRF